MVQHTDIMEQPVKVGDNVIYTWKQPLGYAHLGYIYEIDGLAIEKGQPVVTFKGCAEFYPNSHFLKINTIIPNRPSVDWTADKLMELINSQPRSPRREEIINVLEAQVKIGA